MKQKPYCQIALVIAISLHSNFVFAEWEKLWDMPTGEFFVERDGIYRTKDFAFFNYVINYKEEQNDLFPDYRMKTNSLKAENQINCQDRTIQTKRTYAYSRKFAEGAKYIVPKTDELKKIIEVKGSNVLSEFTDKACIQKPSRWSPLSESDTSELFVDFSSITKENKRMSLDIMLNVSGEGEKVRSFYSRINVECSKNSYVILTAAAYAEKFMSGRLIAEKPGPKEIDISPNDIMDSVRQFACLR